METKLTCQHCQDFQYKACSGQKEICDQFVLLSCEFCKPVDPEDRPCEGCIHNITKELNKLTSEAKELLFTSLIAEGFDPIKFILAALDCDYDIIEVLEWDPSEYGTRAEELEIK